MRHHLGSIILAILAALTAVSGCVEETSPPRSCERDADCGDNQACVSDICQDACVCPAVWKPVCGMDGNTYGNACEAECYGVEVGHEGGCTRGCYSDEECSEGQHCTATEECLPPPACDADDGCADVCYGRCVSDTCDCTDIVAPVCGTDGLTYDNACDARCSGVGVASTGACSSCKELSCGLDCPAGFKTDSNGCPLCQCLESVTFCEPDGTCADPDQLCDKRTCVPSCPECTDCGYACIDASTCACPEPRNPVCGTDGLTYDSLCLAACVGVEKDAPGACATTCPDLSGCDIDCVWGFEVDADGCTLCSCRDEPLLCTTQEDCPDGLQCDPDACVPSCPDCKDCNPACTTAFTALTCASSCAETYEPVCGLDGAIYDNACLAACDGVSVDLSASTCATSSCACDERDAPVCGKDGVTYANACTALCEGVAVADTSACACAGSCETLEPVCGVNGVTYDCQKEAACNGQESRWSGSCSEPILCSSDLDCGSDERCDRLACAPSCPTCDDCNAACR